MDVTTTDNIGGQHPFHNICQLMTADIVLISVHLYASSTSILLQTPSPLQPQHYHYHPSPPLDTITTTHSSRRHHHYHLSPSLDTIPASIPHQHPP
ncbi:unnamed protein product [Gadus morhua 'NCC']